MISVLEGTTIAQIAFGLSTATTSLLIPRRPDVFVKGRAVDAQYTGTALGRSATDVFSFV